MNAIGKIRALVAQDVAVGAVVEQQRDEANALLHRRCQPPNSEHEPAIAGDRDHHTISIGDLDTKGGGKAEAKRSLIALRHVTTRGQDRKAEIGGKAKLRQLADKEAVARQELPNEVKVGKLRLHLFDFRPRLKLGAGDPVTPVLTGTRGTRF